MKLADGGRMASAAGILRPSQSAPMTGAANTSTRGMTVEPTKDDIAAIAAGLSKAQREALAHKNAGGCSHAWAKLGTLEALYSRNLVVRSAGIGSFYSPQTAIEWPLTDIGIRVRQYLQAQSHD